jgi:hypothetical protein
MLCEKSTNKLIKDVKKNANVLILKLVILNTS